MSGEEFRASETSSTFPRENVSVEDYIEAMQQLTDFTRANLQRVTNLEEMSGITKGIGPALRAVVVTHGRFDPGWRIVNGIQLGEYALEREVQGGRISLRVGQVPFDTQEYVSCHYADIRSEGLFKDGYMISIPAIGAIAATHNNPNAQYNIYASQRQRGRNTVYQPVQHSQDRQTQQAYVTLLQRAVHSVLLLNLPSPTDVPAVFRDSFSG